MLSRLCKLVNFVKAMLEMAVISNARVPRDTKSRVVHRLCCSEGVTTGGSLYCDGGVEWLITSPSGGRRLLLDATVVALSALRLEDGPFGDKLLSL